MSSFVGVLLHAPAVGYVNGEFVNAIPRSQDGWSVRERRNTVDRGSRMVGCGVFSTLIH